MSGFGDGANCSYKTAIEKISTSTRHAPKPLKGDHHGNHCLERIQRYGKSRYKARRAELIAERRSNEALARKIALKLSGCVRADKAASLGSLRCKKAEEVERKQNRIYYSKPRSEMGVTCVGRQKIKLGSKPLI